MSIHFFLGLPLVAGPAVVLPQGDKFVARSQSYLSRWDASASLDTTFGEAGRAILPQPGQASLLVIQPDGKILVAGTREDTGTLRRVLYVARYTAQGKMDTTFGVLGESNIDFGQAYVVAVAKAVAIDSRGRIVVAASLVGSGRHDLGVFRLTGEGALDEAFGREGKTIPTLSGTFHPNALYPFSSGGLLVGGTYELGPPQVSRMGVLRLLEEGTPDSHFGKGALSLIGSAYASSLLGVALDPLGRIVGAGTAGTAFHTRFLVARWNNDGQVDESFGKLGVAVELLDGRNNAAQAIAVDGQRLIVVGSGKATNGTARIWVVARYDEKGQLDPTLQGIGYTVTPVSLTDAAAVVENVWLLEGKILVTGHLERFASRVPLVVRYLKDGNLDLQFGHGGKCLLPLGEREKEEANP